MSKPSSATRSMPLWGLLAPSPPPAPRCLGSIPTPVCSQAAGLPQPRLPTSSQPPGFLLDPSPNFVPATRLPLGPISQLRPSHPAFSRLLTGPDPISEKDGEGSVLSPSPLLLHLVPAASRSSQIHPPATSEFHGQLPAPVSMNQAQEHIESKLQPPAPSKLPLDDCPNLPTLFRHPRQPAAPPDPRRLPLGNHRSDSTEWGLHPLLRPTSTFPNLASARPLGLCCQHRSRAPPLQKAMDISDYVPNNPQLHCFHASHADSCPGPDFVGHGPLLPGFSHGPGPTPRLLGNSHLHR